MLAKVSLLSSLIDTEPPSTNFWPPAPPMPTLTKVASDIALTLTPPLPELTPELSMFAVVSASIKLTPIAAPPAAP